MVIKKIENISKDEVKEMFDDVVVIPTETVYGLAARINDDSILKKIFVIKRRPSDNPLITHVSSFEMAKRYITEEITSLHINLIENFWPGPLTIIFKCNTQVSSLVRGNNLDTVGIRMPRNKHLLNIIDILGVPLAAPSANISGRPSPTNVKHTERDLGSAVKTYLDGGPSECGVESTVIKIEDDKIIILRPGSVSATDLQEATGTEVIYRNKLEKGKPIYSPGLKYKHYSPKTPLYLFKGEFYKENMEELQKSFRNVGILQIFNDEELNIKFYKAMHLGTSLNDICRNLYTSLIDMDLEGCDAIFVREVELIGPGYAIMDRLERAASEIVNKKF